MMRKAKIIKTDKNGHTKVGREILAGMQEMLAHIRGEIELPFYEYHPPKTIEVAPIRKQMGMSQLVFANNFGLKVSTLRDWEQGRRQPDGMARILLAIIAKHPEVVHEVLGEFH